MLVFLRIEPFDTKKHFAFVLVIHNGIRLHLVVTILFELFPANRGVKVRCPQSAVPVTSTWRELSQLSQSAVPVTSTWRELTLRIKASS
jgi:hypothetical protein